jgi:hypothetical protein
MFKNAWDYPLKLGNTKWIYNIHTCSSVHTYVLYTVPQEWAGGCLLCIWRLGNCNGLCWLPRLPAACVYHLLIKITDQSITATPPHHPHTVNNDDGSNLFIKSRIFRCVFMKSIVPVESKSSENGILYLLMAPIWFKVPCSMYEKLRAINQLQAGVHMYSGFLWFADAKNEKIREILCFPRFSTETEFLVALNQRFWVQCRDNYAVRRRALHFS